MSNVNSLVGPPPSKNPAFWLIMDFLVPVAILLAGTFLLSPLDVDLQRPHYVDYSGFGQRDGFWGWLYKWGPIPAVVTAIAAIVVAVLGMKEVRLGRWRRVCIFVILLGMLGPGVITNGLLKEYWGRPRPREITQFDGRYAFEPVLTIDSTSPGKSFPCGHSTMGYFFLGGWFIFRRWRHGLAIGFLLGGLGFGALLSYMRMIQGGHFATDGLWAGGVMFLTAAVLYRALGLQRRVLRDPVTQRQRIPLWAKLGASGLGAVAIGVVLLGTPYSATRDVTPLNAASATLPLRVSIDILKGDVDVENSDAFYVKGKAWGHGVPTSQIASKFREEPADDGAAMRLKFHQRESGYFTESGQTLQMGIPWSRTRSAEFRFGPGEVALELGDVYELLRVEIGVAADTALTFFPPQKTPVWCTPAVAEVLEVPDFVIVSESKPSREGGGLIELRLQE